VDSSVTTPKSGSSGSVAKIFPLPNHDHACCSTGAMALAEAKCAARGERLTPMQREVLGALVASHRPLGAYEILERLPPHQGRQPGRHRRPAPYTVYRALEFLCGNGFVHRIESRNAYLACARPHAAGDLIVFLLCERCGTVGETSSPEVASGIECTARTADFDFTPKSTMIEVSGICTHCRRNQNGPQMS